MNNPLLIPFGTAPFEQIKNDHFKPAFLKALKDAKEEIKSISENPEPPTFENTLVALDFAGQHLDRISSLFFNLNSAETNDEIQKIAQEVSPLLTEFSNDIILNEALFQRIKTVFEQREGLQLSEEQKTLLNKRYKSFSRNGANLNEEDKSRLREIDKKLAQLNLKFGENVLAETNKFEMLLTEEDQLSGLPEGVKEAAAQLAKSKGREGWLITLDYPSYIPFMKYAENRELRKELSIAFGSKGFHKDELDNQENVLKIVKLRHERARLLGYDTHAHFVLEERMAETPQRVIDFLDELLEKAKPAAQEEFEELSRFAKKTDGVDQLESWDSAYYSEKLKQERFSLDDEKLKPYFKLENVIAGVFKVAEKLFGLHFKEVHEIEKYHEEVKTYKGYDRLDDSGALVDADFNRRSGERGESGLTC